MKSVDKIPTGKLKRASKLVGTGAKIGVNYLKYYGDRLTKSPEEAKDQLDKNNADDIYDSLKELKGSALKVAQMLSMDKNLLPQAYVEKFSLAQFSVPPLSKPLVIKTFLRSFGKTPTEVFESFELNSINAASIGQVHKATHKNQELAVKIQYPGVADAITSDLALVKPIAIRMFNLKGADIDKYFDEVQSKLLEETNYLLELSQSQEMAVKCRHIPNLLLPRYYPEYTTEKILTMDYMHGQHLAEYTKLAQNIDNKQQLGQTLWNFYMYQLHILRKVHADPHPGNFLVSKQNELIAIDFGCMKQLPEDFYTPYFRLVNRKVLEDRSEFVAVLHQLELLTPEDSPEVQDLISTFFYKALSLFTEPLQSEVFDFSNKDFFDRVAALSEEFNSDKSALKKVNGGRGSEHFIYMNRTFFGLYQLMFDIGATEVRINQYQEFVD